jgi:hypothetical protein
MVTMGRKMWSPWTPPVERKFWNLARTHDPMEWYFWTEVIGKN